MPFLPAERRFDEFNRKGVLVEYLTDNGGAIAGWVLTLEVGVEPPPAATTTSTPQNTFSNEWIDFVRAKQRHRS